jgi:hypothetical protein
VPGLTCSFASVLSAERFAMGTNRKSTGGTGSRTKNSNIEADSAVGFGPLRKFSFVLKGIGQVRASQTCAFEGVRI